MATPDLRDAPTVSGAPRWRKATASDSGSCVEVAPVPGLWRKASASESGHCVEAAASGGAVWVRDSKDPDGPHLTLTGEAFAALLNTLREVGDDAD